MQEGTEREATSFFEVTAASHDVLVKVNRTGFTRRQGNSLGIDVKRQLRNTKIFSNVPFLVFGRTFYHDEYEVFKTPGKAMNFITHCNSVTSL